jgi:hypothetical protein
MPTIALSVTCWELFQRGCVRPRSKLNRARVRGRSQIVGDIVTGAGERVDRRLHFVEYLV